jgi:hypothetical protein
MSLNYFEILLNPNLNLKSKLQKLSSKIWLRSQEFQISNFEYEKKIPTSDTRQAGQTATGGRHMRSGWRMAEVVDGHLLQRVTFTKSNVHGEPQTSNTSVSDV